jgi:hypothetical protein
VITAPPSETGAPQSTNNDDDVVLTACTCNGALGACAITVDTGVVSSDHGPVPIALTEATLKMYEVPGVKPVTVVVVEDPGS